MGKGTAIEKQAKVLGRTRQSAERLEKLLLKSETQVQQSLGAKALERVARDMALFFEGILADITRYAGMLRGQTDQKDPRRRYIRLILANAQRGMAFTGKLLAFGASGGVNLALLNINKFVGDLAHLLVLTVGRNVKLRTALTEHSLPVMADPVRIGQVLVSLVKYGMRNISPGGTITLRTRFLPLADDVHQTSAPKGCALLSITSADIALPPQKRPKLSKSARSEIQLAFSAIRRIIKEHHGAFDIRGQRGRAIQFNIYLPVMAKL